MAKATYNFTIRWVTGPVGNVTAFDPASGRVPFATDQDDISSLVISATIRRGRSDPAGNIGTGTCTIKLRDPAGWFIPGYASSPIVGGAADGIGRLKPYRTFRLRATYDSGGGPVNYDRFYGYITRITPDPLTRTATIEVSDALHRLTLPLKTAYVSGAPGTTSNAILFLITTRFGGDYSYASSAAGNAFSAPLSAAKNAVPSSLIGNLLAADRGLFYARKDGVLQYLDRHWHDRSPRDVAQSTLTNVQLRRLNTGIDVATIANAATVTRTGGTDQVVEDTASQDDFDPRPAQSVSTPYLDTDAQALDTAKWIVAGGKEIAPRGYAADLDGNLGEPTLLAMLSRDLHDRVTLSTARADASDYYIIGINETITDTRKHTVSWLLQKRRAQDAGLIIGYSKIGQSALGYTV